MLLYFPCDEHVVLHLLEYLILLYFEWGLELFLDVINGTWTHVTITSEIELECLSYWQVEKSETKVIGASLFRSPVLQILQYYATKPSIFILDPSIFRRCLRFIKLSS